MPRLHPRAVLAAAALAAALACGGSVAGPSDGPGALDGGAPGTSLAELQAVLRSGAYLAWPAEAATHRSAGPHGPQVRTFVNPLLHDSLRRGAAVHPVGSAVVKEQSQGGPLTGYALDVKGPDGQWVFLEGFLPQLDQYYFQGTDNLCGRCHRAGVDFVLTPAAALP